MCFLFTISFYFRTFVPTIMYYMKRFLVILVAILSVSFCQAGNKKPVMKRVYMFAFTASLVDSTAYMTDIQAVDSAYIMPNGFLADRVMYTVQLDNYLESAMHRMNNTTVVFFDEKKSKLEEKYLQIRKRYQKLGSLHINFLNSDQFRFHGEEYIEPTPEELEARAARAPQSTKSKKDKKAKGLFKK